jgi:hypothetical protein
MRNGGGLLDRWRGFGIVSRDCEITVGVMGVGLVICGISLRHTDIYMLD